VEQLLWRSRVDLASHSAVPHLTPSRLEQPLSAQGAALVPPQEAASSSNDRSSRHDPREYAALMGLPIATQRPVDVVNAIRPAAARVESQLTVDAGEERDTASEERRSTHRAPREAPLTESERKASSAESARAPQGRVTSHLIRVKAESAPAARERAREGGTSHHGGIIFLIYLR